MIFDEQIETITAIEFQSLVFDRERSLFFKWNLPQRLFLAQTFLVRRFQQTRTQHLVYLNRRANNYLGYFVYLHSLRPQRLCVEKLLREPSRVDNSHLSCHVRQPNPIVRILDLNAADVGDTDDEIRCDE
jgi:hypothetical protein